MPSVLVDDVLGKIGGMIIEQINKEAAPDLPIEDGPSTSTFENVKWRSTSVIEGDLNSQIVNSNFTPHPYQKMSMVSNRDATPREDPTIVVFNQSKVAPLLVEQASLPLAQSAAPNLPIEEDSPSTSLIESNFNNQIVNSNFTPHPYQKVVFICQSMVSNRDSTPIEDLAIVVFDQLGIAPLLVEQAPLALAQLTTLDLPIEEDALSTSTFENVKCRRTSVIESDFNNCNFTPHRYQKVSMVSNKDSAPKEDHVIVVFDQSRLAPLPIEQALLGLAQMVAPNLLIEEDASSTSTFENINWRRTSRIESDFNNQTINSNFTPHPYQKVSMVSNRDFAPREDLAIVAFDQSGVASLPLEEAPLTLAQSTTLNFLVEEDAPSTSTFENVKLRRTSVKESDFNNCNFTPHSYQKVRMVSNRDSTPREDPTIVTFNQSGVVPIPEEQVPVMLAQFVAPGLPTEEDEPSTSTSENVKWRKTSVIERNFNNQTINSNFTPHPYQKVSMVSNKDSTLREYPAISSFDQLEVAPLPIEQAPLALAQSAALDLPIEEDAPSTSIYENVKWRRTNVIESNFNIQVVNNNFTAHPYQKVSMVSNGDSGRREDPTIAAFDQSGVAPFPVEQAPLALPQSAAPDLPIKEDVLNKSVATHPQHSPSERKRKSVIQVAVALFAASLTLMLAMLGGMDERERVILGNTISFNVFLVTDMFALVASLAVAMILAFDLPGKVAWLMEMIMWVTAACFLSALLAAGFVVMIPAVKWIVVSFVGAGAMVVALLIYRAFIFPAQSNTQLAIQMSQLKGLNAV